jgi:2-desacetyl-2-hydroxyethyl bacteriochlorophyllide A dehydrogenase
LHRVERLFVARFKEISIMKALIFAGIENVRYETVPDPVPQARTDVVVRVLCAGICGSDLHIYHGRETGLDTGTVMGHEFAGEVVAAGKDVHRFRTGDLVCSPFSVSCGDCFFCEKGLTARCARSGQFFGWVQDGQGLHGAQAEFVRVPFADSTLVTIKDGLSLEEALLLGDNFSTGFFCADMAGVEPTGTYAVVGCSTVGLMCVIAARERGAVNLIAVDALPHRRDLAIEMGATRSVGPDEALVIIRDATDGRGADAVLEAVGSPSAQRLAFSLLRSGGTLAVVGLHTAPHFAFSPLDAYNRNLTYRTGRCPARHYMEQLVSVVARHRDKLQRLISHRLPLSAGVEGYRLFASRGGHCTKVILDPAA